MDVNVDVGWTQSRMSMSAVARGMRTVSCAMGVGLLGLTSWAFDSRGSDASPGEMERSMTELAAEGKFSDRELSAFAGAYLDATRLRTAYDPQIAMETDPDKAGKLRRERDAKISRAIQEAGLSLEAYEVIFSAFSRDDSVRTRVNRFLVEQP